MKKWVLGIALAALSATDASATAIRLYFMGTNANTPTDKITLTGADGTPYQYQGSVKPSPALAAGSTFKVRYQVETNFDPNNLPANSDDGVYRIPIGGPASAGSGLTGTVTEMNLGNLGYTNGPDINVSGLEMVYDPKTGSYTMEMAPGGYDFSGGKLASYTYDPAADVFTLNTCGTNGSCAPTSGHGTADSLLLSGIPVYSPDGEKIGSLDPLLMNGRFEAYLNDVPLGTIPVPAPPAVALFLGALGFLALRSARRRKAIGFTPALA